MMSGMSFTLEMLEDFVCLFVWVVLGPWLVKNCEKRCYS